MTRVGAGGDRLAEVAGLLDAAVGDDRDVAAGLAEVVVAGGGALDRGAKPAARRCRGPRGWCRWRRDRRRRGRRRRRSPSARASPRSRPCCRRRPGIGRSRVSFSKRRPSRLWEMWRAVVTVDWTTKMSQPASTAMGANFLVLAGVQETATVMPCVLHLAHALGDELGLDRLGVDVLQEGRDFGLGGRGDLFEDRRRGRRSGCECLRGSGRRGRRGGRSCRRTPGRPRRPCAAAMIGIGKTKSPSVSETSVSSG